MASIVSLSEGSQIIRPRTAVSSQLLTESSSPVNLFWNWPSVFAIKRGQSAVQLVRDQRPADHALDFVEAVIAQAALDAGLKLIGRGAWY